jgi:glyoxylase-like metal-dependent hydrolase (beta-lactamase superfamily II)
MKSITLGAVDISRVEEMYSQCPPAEMMYQPFDEQVWRDNQHLIRDIDRHPDTHLPMFRMQTWVLRSEGKTILVDPAIGNGKQRSYFPRYSGLNTNYIEDLAAIGVYPDSVDIVVNTHVHMDHVGWNTHLENGEWTPTFPNAQYVLPHADVEYWDPANGDRFEVQHVSSMANAFEDSIQPVLRAGLVTQWEGDHYTIDSNLRLQAAPGHTPGNAVLVLESSTERAAFIGDVMHSPIQLTAPSWSHCYCEDPIESAQVRQKIFEWAADESVLLFPAHMSEDAIEIKRDGSQFGIKGWRALVEKSP